jgi:hypothetical protein
MTRPVSNTGKWLLRIFLGCFLLAIAAPVAIALAVLNISGDTRALRNAAIHADDNAHWKKKIEVNLGSLPFALGRLAMPHLDVPEDARLAFSALRGVDVSVHELDSAAPDRAKVLADSDARMSKRGWDRIVCVFDNGAAVAIYAQGKPGSELKISALVLHERNMVVVSGRARLEPILELAMQKVGETGLLDRVEK